jgi:hypothetical protein
VNPPDNLIITLRVVVEMSELLNISQVAKRLGVSRVTATRMLTIANETCGVEIFRLNGRGYEMTDAGVPVIALAHKILHQAHNFSSPVASQLGGLSYIELGEGAETSFAQQHSINSVWDIGLPEIRATLHAWTVSKGRLEADEFQPVRDRMLIMRKEFDQWIFVEIGERSAMANWLGLDVIKSAGGRPITQNPLSQATMRYLIPPLEHVMTFGGVWYDHISAMFPNPTTDIPERAQYQRLVMRCEFPDTSPALVSLVCITDSISISSDRYNSITLDNR